MWIFQRKGGTGQLHCEFREGSHGLWKGSTFTFPRQTHPGFVSQRWNTLWDDVGHPGLRSGAAQKTCLGEVR